MLTYSVLASVDATELFYDEGPNWQYCRERATFAHHDACEFIIYCGDHDYADSRCAEMKRYGCTPDFIAAYTDATLAGASYVIFYAG